MTDANSLSNPTNPTRKPNQSIYGHQGDQDDSESEDHHAVQVRFSFDLSSCEYRLRPLQVTEIRIGTEDELS